MFRKGTCNSPPPDLSKLVPSQLAEVPTVAKSAPTNQHVTCPGSKGRVAAAPCSCSSASWITPSHLLSSVQTWSELLWAFYSTGSTMLLPLLYMRKMMAWPPQRSAGNYLKLDNHKALFTETNPGSVIVWI